MCQGEARGSLPCRGRDAEKARKRYRNSQDQSQSTVRIEPGPGHLFESAISNRRRCFPLLYPWAGSDPVLLLLPGGTSRAKRGESIATARNLAKGSYPLELDHGGLIMALEELAQRTASQFKISCKILHDNSFQYEHESAIHLYRIAQEGIDNAVRCAFARNIVLECKARSGVVALAVTNDGIPFKYLSARPNGVDFDLMHSRARLFGARLEICEHEIGGTVICWLDKRLGDKNPETL